jgi:hypothetical protein
MVKKILILMITTLCLLCLTSVGYCNEWRDLNTKVEKSGLSTPLHIGAGMAVTGLTYTLLPNSMNPLLRKGIAIVAPIAIGTVKELTDRNFDPSDIGGYAIGAGVSITIISITF